MDEVLEQERWEEIPEFPQYQISSFGRVYNSRLKQILSVSYNNFGNAKISLIDYRGRRRTMSVPLMVAKAFVKAPNILCDKIMLLDGNNTNSSATNIAWRPAYYAWKYTRQLKVNQPEHYYTIPVRNINTGVEYKSIVEAGVAEGVLFDDVWVSTYRGTAVFPYAHQFEIIERV